MKLTGKTKEAFLKWLDTDRRMELHLPDVYLNALIIEFFDSAGIYILPIYEEYEDLSQGQLPVKIKTWSCWVNEILISNCQSRTEATNAAIEKANDLYNSK